MLDRKVAVHVNDDPRAKDSLSVIFEALARQECAGRHSSSTHEGFLKQGQYSRSFQQNSLSFGHTFSVVSLLSAKYP